MRGHVNAGAKLNQQDGVKVNHSEAQELTAQTIMVDGGFTLSFPGVK